MSARRVFAVLLVLGVTHARAASPATDASTKAVAFDRHWTEPYFEAEPLRTARDKFRAEDWTGAEASLENALRRLPKTSPERHPAMFLLALARENLNQWKSAGDLFEDLHAAYPLLAPYHAYHAARCRVRRGDTGGAITWADRVPARSVPEAEAVLVKIDALVTEKRWAAVESETGRFLERFSAGPRRAEASFRRAEAMTTLGRPGADVAAIYRKIWSEAPLESWARRAAEKLAALPTPPTDAGAARPLAWTSDEWLSRALVYFDKNQNVDAENAFNAALALPGLTPADACRARFHLAQSVFKQRQRPRAAPLFAQAEAACRVCSDDDLLVRSLYQGARCLASGGDKTTAFTKYDEIEKGFAGHSYADDARLRAAELATDEGDQARAERLLAGIPQRYPHGDQLGEALWRLAFAAIRTSKWAEAARWLEENLRKLPHEEFWYAEGRALYWRARVYDRHKDRNHAREFYVRAIREYPLSFYALLAFDRLKTGSPGERATLLKQLRAGLSPGVVPPMSFAARPEFANATFLRAVELARLGLGAEARRELARLGFSAADSRDAARKADPVASVGRDEVLWIAATLLDRGRVWSASYAIPRYTLTAYRRQYPTGPGIAEWHLSYPRAFPELIAAEARENHVPEPLPFGIMREESGFNPGVESFANALGLMQLMMPTARRFSVAPVTRDTLLAPASNVAIGTRLLASLLDHFSGRLPLAIAGYNAGEGAVDRWLQKRPRVDLDEFIESIPFDETRNYTKRVLASVFAYAWLYDAATPVPALVWPQPIRKPGPKRSR